MTAIETEVAASAGPLPAPAATIPVAQVSAADMLRPPLLQRMIVGSWVLITINTLIFGFVIFLPQFFLRQGLTITNSLGYTVVLAAASLVGCAVGAWSSDAIGRRWSIIGASVMTIVFGYIYARFQRGIRSGDRADHRFRAYRCDLCADRALIRRLYARIVPHRNQVASERDLQHARPVRHGDLAIHGRLALVHYQLPGVVGLMIALLVVQIIVVYVWGVEPRNRALEDVAAPVGAAA